MKKNIFKKFTAAACLTAVAATTLFTFASCETSYPKAEITVSFNDTDYTLKYELARKLAPSTVRHFIELADNNFYDGLCVHSYETSKWIAGGYKVAEGDDDTKLEEIDYFAAVKNFALTQTVWASPNKENPTGTVYGEFSKNNYKVEGTGAWKQTYGSLSMFYTSKDAEDSVYVDRFDGNGQSYKPYKYNSATSLFYFYTSSSDSAASDNYCTFARLEEKSRDKFAKLLKAVSDYSSDAYGDDGFTEEKKLTANAGDPFESSSTVTAKVPKKAIVIKSVKIKKY